MKKSWKFCTVCAAMLAMLLFGGIMASAASEGYTTVRVTGSFGQTKARTMLDMVNEFRTGDDAWYLDASGQEVRNNLQPLVYDYGLEQSAMQRAMEEALFFNIARPNGESGKTVSEYSVGEVYAASKNQTPENIRAVFKTWKADGKSYASQVSRRNLLHPALRTVGVGHVFHNGMHYWVMAFGIKSSGVSETAPLDGEKTVEVEVANSQLKEKSLNVSVSSISIPSDSKKAVPLPTITGSIKLQKTNTDKFSEVSVVCDWKAAPGGSDIISISSDGITAESAGTTSITTEVFGETVSVPVTVTGSASAAPKDLSAATVSLATNTFTYDGKAKEPAVSSVILEGKKLTAGKDYRVSYKNNINPGTATVTITGIGDYTGSVSKAFTIKEKEIKKIKAGAQAKVNGAKYKVTKAGVSGKAEVAYVAPVNASKASVSIPSSVTIKGFKCKVTSIAAGAFKNNKKLRNVTIPSSIGKIGKQAFYNCRNLTRIEIKSKTLTEKTVGAKAFAGVSSKAVVKFPPGRQKAYKKLLKAKGLG